MSVANFSKSTINNMQIAYKRVFNVTNKDLETDAHKNIMETALTAVWKYSGNFEDETDALADYRRDLQGIDAGKIKSLADHFKKMYPAEFEKTANWDIIYIMYTRMTSSKSQVEVVEEPVKNNVDDTAEPVTKDDSDITNKNNQKEEEINMGINLEDAKKKAMGNTSVAAGSNVKPSDNLAKAAKDKVNDDGAALKANTLGTTATKMILSTRPLVERLVDGEKAVGFIAEDKIEDTWKKFCDVTGYSESTDAFDPEKIETQEVDNARKVLDFLKSAKVDKGITTPVFISKNASGSTKGFVITLPSGETNTWDKEEVRDYIFSKTAGAIKTGNASATLHVAKSALVSSGKKNKPSDKAVNISEISDMGKIVVLKINQRAALMEDKSCVAYWKELSAEHKDQTGAKSALSFKYKAVRNGEVKNMTFRLNLVADMYVTQVTDEEFLKKWGSGEGVRGSQQPIDLTNADVMAAQLEKLAELRAFVASSAVANAQADDIRAIAAQTEKASDAKTEEAFN